MRKVMIDGQDFSYEISEGEDFIEIETSEQRYQFKKSKLQALVHSLGNSKFITRTDGKQFEIAPVSFGGGVGAKGSEQAPMPGKIIDVLVQEGQRVKLGDTLLKLEAMKMEHSIKADREGMIEKLFFKTGAQVKQGDQLFSMVRDHE